MGRWIKSVFERLGLLEWGLVFALAVLVLQVFPHQLFNACLWVAHYASPSQWPNHLLLWVNFGIVATLLATRLCTGALDEMRSNTQAKSRQVREKARITEVRERREAIRRAKEARKRRVF